MATWHTALSVKLPEETKQRIQSLAKSQGTTAHAVMVSALEGALEKEEHHNMVVAVAQWVLSEAPAQDLEEPTDFLLKELPHEAVNTGSTVGIIVAALGILEQHPRFGRPLANAMRELVISRGRTGYLALYEYDEEADLVLVLAVRHQREQDYR